MRRLAFVQSGLARKGLLAIGISLLAVALLAVLEGMALRWAGMDFLNGPDRYSVIQFCPARGEGSAVSLFWRRRDESEGGLEHFLQLHQGPLGRHSTYFSWEGLSPRSAAWTGAGGNLAIGSLEGTIYTWDASNPKTLPAALGHHRGCAMMLAATADGRWLASANDWLVCVWDLHSRQLVWQRDDLAANSLALHPLTNAVVCGTGHGDVLELDITTGQTERVLARHTAAADCVAVSADGARIASVGGDKRLVVTDWQRAETVWIQRHHANSELCFSPAGDTLVSSAFIDNAWTLLTWDASTGRPQTKLLGHTSVILGLTITPDNTLYSWGTEGTIRTWDLSRRVERNAFKPAPSC